MERLGMITTRMNRLFIFAAVFPVENLLYIVKNAIDSSDKIGTEL